MTSTYKTEAKRGKMFLPLHEEIPWRGRGSLFSGRGSEIPCCSMTQRQEGAANFFPPSNSDPGHNSSLWNEEVQQVRGVIILFPPIANKSQGRHITIEDLIILHVLLSICPTTKWQQPSLQSAASSFREFIKYLGIIRNMYWKNMICLLQKETGLRRHGIWVEETSNKMENNNP